MPKETLITDIQRFSVHDGPGIRTTIFFKGCPLRCKWCHNPETLQFENELVYTKKECILCGDCKEACAEKAVSIIKDKVYIDEKKCTLCLECTQVCPSRALEPAAKKYNSTDLAKEVLRDQDFYNTDGGITLSGGEPLVQAQFLEEFLPLVKNATHVAAETCGYWSYEALNNVLNMIDLFLFDIKAAESKRHEELTGKPNDMILKNLEKLIKDGRQVQVRMPVVQGFNDDTDNLAKTSDLLKSFGLKSITLLPYHTLGEVKLAKINSDISPLNIRSMSKKELGKISEFFKSCGIESN
jgi:pyruvate formate lyase activating enzyme